MLSRREFVLYSFLRRMLFVVISFLTLSLSYAADFTMPIALPVEFTVSMYVSDDYSENDPDPEPGYTASLAGEIIQREGSNLFTVGTAELIPGKEYHLSWNGIALGECSASFSIVAGYRLYLNDRPSYIVERLDDPYADDKVKVVLLPVGEGEAAGVASSIEGGNKIIWSVGLGNLLSGQGAGSLQIREENFSNDLFRPESLLYTDFSSEVTVIGDQGDSHRQIDTNEAFVDISTVTSSQYSIKFYEPSQKGSLSGDFYTVSGSPYISYTVYKYLGNSNKLGIKKTVGLKQWYTRLEKNTDVWTLYDWHENGIVQRKKIWTIASDGSYKNIEITDGSGVVASSIREEYNSYGQLTKEIHGYGEVDLETTFTYDSKGRLQTMTRHDGSWVYEEYSGGLQGLKAIVIEPYLNSPSSAPSSSSSSSGKKNTTSYVQDWSYAHTLPSETTSKVNGVTVGKTKFSYSYPSVTVYGDSERLMEVTREDYSVSSKYLKTISKSFRVDTNNDRLINLVYSVKKSDKSKASYAYLNGEFSTNNMIFTPSANGTYWMESRYHGTSDPSAGNAVSSAGSSGYIFNMDTIYMVPNVSTRVDQVRDPRGRPFYEATYLYTGSGYVLIKGERTTRDALGNVTERREYYKNGSGLNSKVVYSASYANGQKEYEIDGSGIRVEYTYDSMGRVEVATRKGFSVSDIFPSGSPNSHLNVSHSQSDVRTQYAYNADGQITQTTILGSSPIESGSEYDTAGRITREYSPGQSGDVDVLYTYPGNLKMRMTYPDLGYTEQEFYRDGKLKKVSGTAAVPEYLTYSINSSGIETETRRFVLGSNDGWSQKSLDWLGRPYQSKDYAWDGSVNVSSFIYDDVTGQLKRTTLYGGGVKLIADTVYEYDLLGRIVKEGLDLNDNQKLDASSNDRFKEFTVDYVQENGIWYARSLVESYSLSNNSTKTLLSKSLNRISNLSSTYLAEGIVEDLYGNRTKTEVKYDSSRRRVYSYVTKPGISRKAESVQINGLEVAVYAADGSLRTVEYDSYSRKSKEEGRDDMETSYIYYPGTTLLWSTRNKFIETSRTEYDVSGRVRLHTREDSFGNEYNTYKTYNERGQILREWGNATTPVEYSYNSYGWKNNMKMYRGGSDWTGASWPSNTGAVELTTWNFNGKTGLLNSKVDDFGRATSFQYNDRGQVSKKTLARNISGTSTKVAATYSYYEYSNNSDVSNRTGELKKIDYNDSTHDVEYRYRRHGRISQVHDVIGWRYFDYRTDLQLARERLPDYYGYDPNNDIPTAITHNYDTSNVVGRKNGLEVGYYSYGSSYNDSNAIYDIAFGFEAASGRVKNVSANGEDFVYTYKTGSSLLWKITNENSSFTYERIIGWQSWRKLVDTVETTWDGSQKALYVYDYDWLGRKTRQKEKGTVATTLGYSSYGIGTEWMYNERSELEYGQTYNLNASFEINNNSVVPNRYFYYEYDNAQNRKKERLNNAGASLISYSVNDLNQYTNTPSTSGTLQYDYDGNVSNDQAWIYEHDAENRISKMTLIGGTSLDVLLFEYDYMGRRVSRKQNGIKIKYLYDGWNIIAEMNSSASTVFEKHYWGLDVSGTVQGAGGIGGLLMTTDGASNYFPAYDGQGNVTGMLNEFGSMKAAYEYNAKGEVKHSAGSYRFDNEFGFSTKQTDGDSGFVNFGYRQYNPELGRFINRDPIGESGGLNLYAFLNNGYHNGYEYLGMGFFSDIWEDTKKAFKATTNFVKGNFWLATGRLDKAHHYHTVAGDIAFGEYADTARIIGLTFIPVVGPFLAAGYSAYLGYQTGGVFGAIVGAVGGFAGATSLLASTNIARSIAVRIASNEAYSRAVQAVDRRIRGFGKWYGRIMGAVTVYNGWGTFASSFKDLAQRLSLGRQTSTLNAVNDPEAPSGEEDIGFGQAVDHRLAKAECGIRCIRKIDKELGIKRSKKQIIKDTGLPKSRFGKGGDGILESEISTVLNKVYGLYGYKATRTPTSSVSDFTTLVGQGHPLVLGQTFQYYDGGIYPKEGGHFMTGIPTSSGDLVVYDANGDNSKDNWTVSEALANGAPSNSNGASGLIWQVTKK